MVTARRRPPVCTTSWNHSYRIRGAHAGIFLQSPISEALLFFCCNLRAGGGGDSKKVSLLDFKPNKEIGAFLKLVPLLGSCFSRNT
jgi:hypothetical protein